MRFQMKIWFCVITFLACAFCGCENGGGGSLQDDFEKLSLEKSELQSQVEQLEKDNRELTRRLGRLSELPQGVKTQAMPELDRIELGRRTALYDKDEDGRKDELVVYISPYDTTGDTIKAPGSVKISLWDLETDSGVVKVGEWRISGGDLKRMWAGTFLTNYYRVVVDAGKVLTGDEGELTLHVSFADFIGGKVLTAQKVLKP